MNEIMTVMINGEVGEVETINGFFYTIAFAERVEIVDIREADYEVL